MRWRLSLWVSPQNSVFIRKPWKVQLHTTITMFDLFWFFLCCVTEQRCNAGQFACRSGKMQCIPMSWQCDGWTACEDKSDEMDCPRECTTTVSSPHCYWLVYTAAAAAAVWKKIRKEAEWLSAFPWRSTKHEDWQFDHIDASFLFYSGIVKTVLFFDQFREIGLFFAAQPSLSHCTLVCRAAVVETLG